MSDIAIEFLPGHVCLFLNHATYIISDPPTLIDALEAFREFTSLKLPDEELHWVMQLLIELSKGNEYALKTAYNLLKEQE